MPIHEMMSINPEQVVPMAPPAQIIIGTQDPLPGVLGCSNKQPKIKIVIGSTFGDEGKGNVVQWLCQQALNAGKKVAVVRYSGGPQAAHTVYYNGIKHICSSYGAGVLLNVPTILSSNVLIDPISMQKERRELISKGIKSPKIILDSICPNIITPFDVYFNQQDLKTLNDGSCGKGINAAQQRISNGYYSLDSLENWNAAKRYYKDKHSLNIELSDELKQTYISAHNWFNRTVQRYFDYWDFDELILEGSQGLLLDEDFGFNPHTTPSRVGLNGCFKYYSNRECEVYFVTRTYLTRHGNGYEPKHPITIPEWKEESNITNQFQGVFKTGILEIPLLQRAFDRHNIINTCRKHNISSKLVVTHTDLIDKGVINSFLLNNAGEFVMFEDTKSALQILTKELDGYLNPENVYYCDNPNSDIKQYV